MKKTSKKLALQAQTIKPLSTPSEVAGAGNRADTLCTERGSGCIYDITYTCEETLTTICNL